MTFEEWWKVGVIECASCAGKATARKGFEAGAASRDAEIVELVAALEMIAWSNDSEWQADCAKSALAKVRQKGK